MNWYVMAFQKYVDFSGRSRRKEYWMFMLFNVIIILGLVFITSALSVDEDFVAIPMATYFLAIIIPSIAVTVRRLHDIGKSGWYILIRFIPIIGSIWLIALLCYDSEYRTNKYGLNPKNPVDNELNDIGISEA